MPLNPIKSELSYWNKKIAIVDNQKMGPCLGPVKIGKNYYYGRELYYEDKADLIFEKIIPTLFISIVLAPIAIPSLFIFTNVYRHLIRWIKEVHYGRKLKCINNVAQNKLKGHSTLIKTPVKASESSSESSSKSDSNKSLADSNANKIPPEVLRLIFSSNTDFDRDYLERDYGDTLGGYFSTLPLVCKAWHSQVPGAKIDFINKGFGLKLFPKMNRNSQMFEYIKTNATNLRILNLIGYVISTDQIKDLLRRCPQLQSLTIRTSLISKDISGFKEMKKLVINGCRTIEKGALNFPELEELAIIDCEMEDLPSFKHLPKLKKLHLEDNSNLKTILSFDFLFQLKSLKIIKNHSLTSIHSLNLNQLTLLMIRNNYLLPQIPSLDNLFQLEELYVCCNHILAHLPSFKALRELKKLEISYNDALINIPSLVSLDQLEELRIEGNSNIQVLPSFSNLSSLQNLRILSTESLQTIPSLSNLSNLRELVISWNKSLQTIPSLSNLSNLRYLKISWNKSLQTIPSLSNLFNLEFIRITDNASKLQRVQNLFNRVIH